MPDALETRRLDAAAVRRWLDLGLAGLGHRRAEIDALNVFPVPDGDTGTNLFLTLEAAVSAVAEDAPPDGDLPALVAAVSQGALLGARGNSGIIVSQLVRGFGEVLASAGPDDDPGITVAEAFRRAADSAYAAVAEPKEGTVLTVARAAADSTAGLGPGTSVAAVLTTAADAAAEALERTPDQLEALRRAGVVDAGGRGLVVLLDALVESVTGEHREQAPTALPVHHPSDGVEAQEEGGAYEVMYLLDADDAAVPRLRGVLAGLGDSLVVVGGNGLWNVHVHTDDVGAAIEAGIEAGRPHRIRVTDLCKDTALRRSVQAPGGRVVVAVAHGAGTAALLEASGARVVRAHGNIAPSTGEVLEVLRSTTEAEVVLLPSESDIRPVAEAAADVVRRDGRRASVVPTRSIVQTLAAVAVHDSSATFEDDVVAMTRAAGATRYGGVSVAVKDAVTSAGVCRVGDVLGIAGGDVVEIGSSVEDVAVALLGRLLATGGELVTLVRGDEGGEALVDAVARRVRRGHAGTEVVVYDGGQPYWPLILGVE